MIKRGLNPKLSEIGKIKMGYKGKEVISKKGNKFRPPKKLDYFVITTTERDVNKNLIQDKFIMDRIKEVTNQDKIRELRIRLPFDSVDKNFFTQFQFYSGRKKICSGDGIIAEWRAMQNGKVVLPFYDEMKEVQAVQGQVYNIKCDPEECEFSKAGKCKVSGILSAFLPDARDLGGVYKFRTHSYNSVSSILAALEYFKEQTGGILQGMPLKLVMVKKTTEEHGTIDYCTVVIDGVEVAGLRRAALEEKNNRKLLGADIAAYELKQENAGFFKDTDPEDVVNAEYYPETVEIEEKRDKGTSPEELTSKLDEPKQEEEKTEPKQDKEELF